MPVKLALKRVHLIFYVIYNPVIILYPCKTCTIKVSHGKIAMRNAV